MVLVKYCIVFENEIMLEMLNEDLMALTFLQNHRLTFQDFSMIEKMISKENQIQIIENKKFLLTKCIISGFLTSVTCPPPSYIPNFLVSPIVNVNGPKYKHFSIELYHKN
jgi:hypothetical protein